jgi:hypothetical protein
VYILTCRLTPTFVAEIGYPLGVRRTFFED